MIGWHLFRQREKTMSMGCLAFVLCTRRKRLQHVAFGAGLCQWNRSYLMSFKMTNGSRMSTAIKSALCHEILLILKGPPNVEQSTLNISMYLWNSIDVKIWYWCCKDGNIVYSWSMPYWNWECFLFKFYK